MWRWLVDRWRRHTPDQLSLAWLLEQDRREQQTFDGPAWSWPVRKARDEHAAWNTKRLKQTD